MIRKVALEDAPQIMNIYNHYVDHTIYTFDTERATLNEIQDKIRMAMNIYPWIVYEVDGEILGYAYASEWKAKDGYKHSVETTVYLKNGSLKKGLGTILYQELINQLKELNFHALMGCITLPNDASIRLHEKLGFEKVGHFKEVGYKFDNWIDVGYWELRTHN